MANSDWDPLMVGYKNRDFRSIFHFILETIQDRAIFTIERQYELIVS